ncbi:MAG: ABC transporter permease subunit [Planctomycetes bacterium]|nr:ABC transporter permease subunit [Planctomycetota bacterium]
MLSFIARRLMLAAPMLIGVSIAAFLLLHVLPGDPARAILGQRATKENVEQFRESQGLNDPLQAQYVRFIEGVARGELGSSHRTNRPVLDELKEKVPATIELTVFAMLFASVVGISLGILAAIKPRTIWDFICLGFALIGVSMPIFWLGFLVQKAFAGGLDLFPFGDRLDIAKWPTFHSDSGFFLYDALFVYQNAELTFDVLHHLMLPAMVLATVPMALIARMTRANMLEVLDQDYIRTARAKGLSNRPVILRHAMRNALIPVITAIGTQFGYLLGGAVLTETIFSWPGLGRYVIDAIDVLDAKPLQASVMLIAVVFISVNLLTDLSYAIIDPRLRHGGAKGSESTSGVGWLKFGPWALAGVPWFALLVLVLVTSTGRVPADALTKPWVIVLVLIGLEIAALIVWLIVSGAILQLLTAVRDLSLVGLAHGWEIAADGFKFLRKHKPALAGMSLILLMVVAAVGAPLIAPFDPMEGLNRFHEPVSSQFWLGTDSQGRDLFSRLVFGARTTLLVALAATLLSLVLGTLIGALAGYFGGAVDSFLMRAIDFMMSFPSFLLAVVTVAVLGKSLENLIWAVGIVGIPLFARQVRAEALRVKSLEYVEAARSLGFGHVRILARTVLPNCLSPIIVLGTLGMGSAILDVAGLAFLGLGGDPFVPEWGLILKHGWDESSKGAFQVGVAGACILGTVLGFNLLGDGLRDWLDPRTRLK